MKSNKNRYFSIYKITYIILVSFAFNASVNGQKIKTENYLFSIYERLEINKPKFFSLNKPDFETKRIYHSSNEFSEVGLFSADEEESFRFRIVNKKWFLYQDDNWNLFFDKSKLNYKPKLIINERKYYLRFKKTEYVDSFKTYVFVLTPSKGFSSSTKIVYYFNPIKGVLKTNINGIDYYRTLLKAGSFARNH